MTTDAAVDPARRRFPGRRLVLLLAVPLGLLLAGYLLLMPREDVPLPARDASPEQVVTAYLEALNARDHETSNALFPDAAHAPRGLFSAFERVDLVRIEQVVTTKDHARVQFVAEFSGGDGSLHGRETWGYDLTRADDGPWVITGQGMG